MSMNFAESKKMVDLCRYCTIDKGSTIVPLLLGETGIGKTELVREYCEEKGLDLIVLHMSQMEPSDFNGLFKVNKFGKTDICSPSWLPWLTVEEFEDIKKNQNLSEEELKKLEKGVINPKGGIVFFDEVNRGHEDIRQSMYQLINERRTNHYDLPKNYTIVAAANPTDGYETYEFDKALINRFAWIDFQPSAKESATYLAQKYPNSIFAPWILMNEEMLEISPSQTNSAFDNSMDDKKSFSPRIVENLMILSIVLEERGEKTSFKNKVYRSIAPKGKVDSMLQWDAEAKNLISIDDVLSGKGKEEVESYIKKQRMDLISVLTQRLSQFFTSYEFSAPRTEKEDAMVKNLFDFLHAVPREMAFVFINGVTTQYYETKDGKRYKKQQAGCSLKINEHSLLTQPEFTAVGKEKYDFYEFGSLVKDVKNIAMKTK